MVLGESIFTCTACNWEVSSFDVNVEQRIMRIVEREQVAYRNEFRYRLEREFFHTVTDYALRRLDEGKAYSEGLKLARTGLPGRRSIAQGTPNVFYKATATDYPPLLPIMKKKLELSEFVSEMAGCAGFHAQYLWRDAFADLGYRILKEDVSEFEGKKVEGGDIDFVAEKDGVRFGVEVKNGLEYPNDLGNKVRVAIELGTIPVMVVRRVAWDVYANLKKYGVLTKIYETCIMPSSYESVVAECVEVLGMPLIALDAISGKTRRHLEEKVMWDSLEKVEFLKGKNKTYLTAVNEQRRRLEALNKELRFI